MRHLPAPDFHGKPYTVLLECKRSSLVYHPWVTALRPNFVKLIVDIVPIVLSKNKGPSILILQHI